MCGTPELYVPKVRPEDFHYLSPLDQECKRQAAALGKELAYCFRVKFGRLGELDPDF